MKKPFATAVLMLVVAVLAAHVPEALSQVVIDNGSAAKNRVSTILGFFLGLVQIAGYSLFTIAVMLAAYKITFVEGYKASDAKGIVIGGIVFGLAAAMATYITST